MRELFFLTVGTLAAPRALLSPQTRLWHRGTVPLPLTIAVVVRDDGGIVLVDAGFSAAACRDCRAELGALRTLSLQPRLRPEDAARAQLSALGLDPARVTAVVSTHLHLDHVGGVTDFPNAELVTTPDELRAFASLPPNVGYRPDDLAATGRIRVVPLTGEARLGFAASADLYGDGEVLLLDARGHTRGHVAVALRGPERSYLHIGDAAYQAWEYGPAAPRPCRLAQLTSVDREQLLRTRAILRACADDPAGPVLVPSHDQGVLNGLPRAPRAGEPR